MYRTVFLGSPQIALDAVKILHQSPHFQLCAVLSQVERPQGRGSKLQNTLVSQWALQQGIPLLKPSQVGSCLEELKALKLDVLVVVAYGQILPQSFFKIWPRQIVNVHASLLPALRGAAPIQRCLMEGATESGLSLQVMQHKLDAGDVISQRPLSISQDMNAKQLMDKMSGELEPLLTQDLTSYLEGKLKALPQDESGASYAPKIQNSESKLDWTCSAQHLHNQIRALVMGPVAQMTYKKKAVKVYKSQVCESETKFSESVGQVWNVDKTFFDVVTGQGLLRILELQMEGKKRLSAEEFLKGSPLKKGGQCE